MKWHNADFWKAGDSSIVYLCLEASVFFSQNGEYKAWTSHQFSDVSCAWTPHLYGRRIPSEWKTHFITGGRNHWCTNEYWLIILGASSGFLLRELCKMIIESVRTWKSEERPEHLKKKKLEKCSLENTAPLHSLPTQKKGKKKGLGLAMFQHLLNVAVRYCHVPWNPKLTENYFHHAIIGVQDSHIKHEFELLQKTLFMLSV